MLEGDQKICTQICLNILESILILFERIILVSENNAIKKCVFFYTNMFLCLYISYDVQHRNT